MCNRDVLAVTISFWFCWLHVPLYVRDSAQNNDPPSVFLPKTSTLPPPITVPLLRLSTGHLDTNRPQWKGLSALVTNDGSRTLRCAKPAISSKRTKGRQIRRCSPHAVTGNRHHQMLRVLVKELGADTCVKDTNGVSPLHHAADYSQHKAMRVLVKELGADVAVEDSRGLTSLHRAAMYGRLKAIRVLVNELGADVGFEGSIGYSPLHLAVKNGHLEAVRVLGKEFGANVTFPACTWEPLHVASDRGHDDIIRVLVDGFGADVDASVNGFSALDLAARSGFYDETVRLLKEFGAK